ncbi:hypothetical protein BJP62_16375 [Jeongeupia sp. USM3]|nr:hypothetical protein BJP62_16375 [Jeongeupia sp. USM3]
MGKLGRVAVSLAGLLAPATQAAVDETDPLIVHADVSTVYDSNVFRLADGVPAAQYGGSKADVIVDPSVGIRANWPVSRQVLLLDAQLSRPTYTRHRQLDYTGWQGLLAWDWQWGSAWSGRLGYSDERTLSEFEDVQLGIKDLVRKQGGELSTAYALTSDWALQGSLTSSRQQHDRRRYLDLRQDGAGGGVRYRSGLGGEVSARLDYMQVEYSEALLTMPADERGYRQWQARLGGVWPLGAKTRLQAGYGWTNWKYRIEDDWQRSPTGDIALSWQASEKTRLYADYRRAFEAPGQNIGRNLIEGYGVGGAWQATALVGVELSWRREDKQLRQVLAYSQQTDYWRLGLKYRPDPAWQLSVYGQHQARDSALSQNDYRAVQAGVDLKVMF